ncbi:MULTISPECIES: hypothetical protein [Catenuloplanes]|uniref:Uncharacterized protein n=1 Tax=Catenuloplanes niger TaxID=587534 RepID=A0AAE3ZVU5_9ACTN|nr:hypothetical protein [Catenuloplanes niger]MDR7326943.1 hypothetical protein [Catenuloplanes niger]
MTRRRVAADGLPHRPYLLSLRPAKGRLDDDSAAVRGPRRWFDVLERRRPRGPARGRRCDRG